MGKLEVGQVVTIYEDPLTEQKVEGEATLIEFVCKDGGVWEGRDLERWLVRFGGKYDYEESCARNILTPPENVEQM